MFDTEQEGLSGVLVNNKKQAVRCVVRKATVAAINRCAVPYFLQRPTEGGAVNLGTI